MIADLGAAALRLLPAEPAHKAAIAALKWGLGPRARADEFPALRTVIAGLDLPNPIGLAAGFDKDAVAPDSLLAAGFGFVECGTVTPRPQTGNPRPRLFRLAEDGAVINRMGFNNAGLDAFSTRLARRRGRGVIGANVGANKDSEDRAGDYAIGLRRVWPHASYVTINISSPNTPGLRGLQERGALEDLLGRTGEARAAASAQHGPRPVFLKVSPDLDETSIADIARLVVAARIDGVIVSNTTIYRPASLRSAARGETGGLSGKPLFEKSTRVLNTFFAALGGRAALVGAGGVDSGAAALAKIRAGAGAVQLYTALAYSGPALVRAITRDLAAALAAEGFRSTAEAIGSD